MVTLSIISFPGVSTDLAESVEKGAESIKGIKTKLIPVEGTDIINGFYQNEKVMETLDASDGMIFCCPAYQECVLEHLTAFAYASASRWIKHNWSGKLAAGFALPTANGQTTPNTIQHLETLAIKHGMVWMGLGEMFDSNSPIGEEILTAELLGKRVGTLSLKFMSYFHNRKVH